jgi:hypothetical protein
MASTQSPLLGYNTNIRHKGKLYHIQTEDSGVSRPHIITHLFADGGRIVSSRKTGYAEHVGSDNLEEVVRNLMKEQHKAMAVDLRDGVFDDDEPKVPAAEEEAGRKVGFDVDALERAALEHEVDSAARNVRPGAHGAGTRPSGLPYQLPAAPPDPVRRSQPPGEVFGDGSPRSKSLDEVILAYLHDDMVDDE